MKRYEDRELTSGDLDAFLAGCYVATCVYGSYDCPQVWTLRRFRDDTLGSTWYGRTFIRVYYGRQAVRKDRVVQKNVARNA